MKKCTSCEVEKDVTEFGVFEQRGDTFVRGQCNSCRSALERQKRVDDPERARKIDNDRYYQKKAEDPVAQSAYYRDWHLRNKYDMTLAEFDALAASLDYLCEICGREETVRKNLAVDHNHETGNVRGLLCASCNSALGLLQDSPYVLEAATAYLKERGHYGK